MIEPLLRGARDGVERVRPHLLRTALALQLQDTAEELREIVSGLPASGSAWAGGPSEGWTMRYDGGFVTYGSAAKESLTPGDQAGWFEPEVSVTASAVLALSAIGRADAERLERACEFIRRSRRDDLWESYWWRGFGYATYHSLLALSKDGGERYVAQLAATQQAVLGRRSARGGWATEPGAATDAFSTSFALRVLLLGDGPRARP